MFGERAEHRASATGLQLLAAARGERVLDVGTGTGRALSRLALAVGPDGLACGVDISGRMSRLAARRVRPRGGAVQQGDARALPFRDKAFDAALISFTLELFTASDMALALGELARVLKREGRLVVVALNAQRSVAAAAYAWLHRHLPDWLDCRPICVRKVLSRHGWVVRRSKSLRLWGLPVQVVLATAWEPDTSVGAVRPRQQPESGRRRRRAG